MKLRGRLFFLSITLFVLAACSSVETRLEQNALLNDLPVNQTLSTVQSDLSTTATESYNITLELVGEPGTELVTALQNGAKVWEAIVTEGLAEVSGSIAADSCGDNPAFSGTIDDVLIFAGQAAIDGPGNVLAQAGPCSIRTSNGLTVYGVLIFDEADVAGFSGQLADIAVHEMGHILGIGTLWDRFGLVARGKQRTLFYTGSDANSQYQALGGSGSTPVEESGGQGTAGGHWDEEGLDNELMTGYINSGENPLSKISVGTLSDMGYAVTYATADDYTVTTSGTGGDGGGNGGGNPGKPGGPKKLFDAGLHELIITPTNRVN